MKRTIRLMWSTLLALLMIPPVATVQAQLEPYRAIGYYTYYSIYELDYLVTDIPAETLTHLIYAHVSISDNGQCVSTDEYADTEFLYPDDTRNQRMRGNFNQLQILNEENPGLTLMMSIGGWEDSENFSEVAATQETRERFVQSCVIFMRNNGFEGIDLDWRYPVDGGQFTGEPEDAANYAALVREFRFQLDYREDLDERRYELSVATPPFPLLLEHYALSEMATEVDFFNVSTFGYEGSWSQITGHIAPLFPTDNDPRASEAQSILTIDGAVNIFLDAGVASEQIVIGVPLYGQSWQGIDVDNYFGLFSEHGGIPGETRDGGLLYFRDLVRFENNSNWTRFFDTEAGVPWLYNEDAFIGISYENIESVRNKIRYVQQSDLGGMFVWQLSYDDPSHQMLNEIARMLNGE